MNKVLVTGGNGQLASSLKDAVVEYPKFDFVFKSSEALDITSEQQMATVFEEEQPNFCINCAAYTAVDKAESDEEKAININTNGASNIAKACVLHKAKLIHISTDFVFDGKTSVPYKEEDQTNPLGVYGQSKLDGESAIEKILKEHFILRTSWLYSEYGRNFVKTMLRLGDNKKELKVVNDQIGSPTYASDLAAAILLIINKNTDKYGIYHFSNEGSTTWFGFAKKIFELSSFDNRIHPVTTEEYPTQAKRPFYSVLNTDKIKKTFDLKIANWEDSLKKCLIKLDKET